MNEPLLREKTKNHYLANGHNYQISILPLYLPSSRRPALRCGDDGRWLEGAPIGHAPGFPTTEQGWTVRWEGLLPAL